MTTITNSEIRVAETPMQVVKYGPAGRQTKLLNSASVSSSRKDNHPIVSLYSHTPNAGFIHRCQHSLLLSSAETSRNPFFHQACVYLPQHEELYITSDLLQSTNSGSLPIILISRIKLHRRRRQDSGRERSDDGRDDDDAITSVEWAKLRPPQSMAMPASGIPYSQGMVFCSQGNLTEGTGGLYYMPHNKPPVPLVTGFYGKDFNSPYDVVLTKSDGALWFTDPRHGHEKDFRKRPSLPCHVYRFHPATDDLRVVVDGLGRPTGIAFSPDGSTAYITDTDACRADGTQDESRPATIYAYDVVIRANSPFLCNKRVFAVPIAGIPIGVKCDDKGFVYAGCADGIEVWNAGGALKAVIEIPGGVTNFCFGRCDNVKREMFVCANQRLWRLLLLCSSSSLEDPLVEQASLMDW